MIDLLKALAKKLQSVRQVRLFIISFKYYLFKILIKSTIFAGVYELFISRNFSREINAMTHGIYEYYRSLKLNQTNTAILRRNIHRLEKGMLMHPKRPLFALNYIEETLDVYLNALKLKSTNHDTGQIKWAHDVLEEYFKISDDSNPLIRKLAKNFRSLPYSNKPEPRYIPYLSSNKTDSNVNYADFLNLSRQRKSVRWFQKKKVPRKLLDKAIAAASLAPSACNRQPFEYRIFDDKELVSQIAGIPFGAAGYAHNIPVIIVLIGDMSNFFSERDRHLIYIDTSLSAMAFIYALETLGLSSTGINWPDFGILEKKMVKALKLKHFERPIFLLAVGYPDDTKLVAQSVRKAISALRSYN